jgi:hypothetical protein
MSGTQNADTKPNGKTDALENKVGPDHPATTAETSEAARATAATAKGKIGKKKNGGKNSQTMADTALWEKAGSGPPKWKHAGWLYQTAY